MLDFSEAKRDEFGALSEWAD